MIFPTFFSPKKKPHNNLVRYSPDRRHIFGFWNGVEIVYLDPVEIEISLETHEKYEPQIHIQQAWDGDVDALDVVCDAIRRAFEIPVFDGKKGLTREELYDLLAAFNNWQDEVKKNFTPMRSAPRWVCSSPKTTTKSQSESKNTDSGCTDSKSKISEQELSTGEELAQSQNPTEDCQLNQPSKPEESTQKQRESGTASDIKNSSQKCKTDECEHSAIEPLSPFCMECLSDPEKFSETQGLPSQSGQ